MASKKSKVADPVREVIRQIKTAGAALMSLIEAVSRDRLDKGEELNLTVSRTRVSGLIIEFSTTSPGRRQTIRLLVMGDEVFIQIPGSVELVKKIKNLARRRKTKSGLQRRLLLT